MVGPKDISPNSVNPRVKLVVINGEENTEIITELRRRAPQLTLDFLLPHEAVERKAEYKGIVYFTCADDVDREIAPESTPTGVMQGIQATGGYLLIADLAMKFPRASQRIATPSATISILTPREPGFDPKMWPDRMLSDITQQFPEISGPKKGM